MNAPPTHGRGDGLQAWIAGLSRASRSQRAEHLANLRSALVFRGRWTTAAAAVIPDLIALLEDETVADRHRILVLLADLVGADHADRIATLLRETPAETRPALDPAADATGRALLADLPTILGALQGPDPLLRAGAALVLACLPIPPPQSVRASLAQQLTAEADPAVQTSLALALALTALAGEPDRAHARLFELWRDAQAPTTRGAAALGCCWLRPGDPGISEADRASALADLITAEELDADRFPWLHGRADRLVQIWSEAAGGDALSLGARSLAAAVSRGAANDRRVREWSARLLKMVFEPGDRIRPAIGLTALQVQVLGDLSRQELGDPGFSAHGLPQRAVDRRRWLGIAPPGPLEQPVRWPPAGDPDERPLYEVLAELQGRGPDGVTEIARLFEALLPPEDQLAVLTGLSEFAYWLTPLAAKDLFRITDRLGRRAEIWASGLAEEQLSAGPLGPHQIDLGQAALLTLVKNLRPGEHLDPRYAALIELNSPVAAEILAGLQARHLEALLVRNLDSIEPPAPLAKLDQLLRLVPLCPTDAVAKRLVHLTAPATLERWIGPERSGEESVRYREQLTGLGAENQTWLEALKRAGA